MNRVGHFGFERKINLISPRIMKQGTLFKYNQFNVNRLWTKRNRWICCWMRVPRTKKHKRRTIGLVQVVIFTCFIFHVTWSYDHAQQVCTMLGIALSTAFKMESILPFSCKYNQSDSHLRLTLSPLMQETSATGLKIETFYWIYQSI